MLRQLFSNLSKKLHLAANEKTATVSSSYCCDPRTIRTRMRAALKKSVERVVVFFNFASASLAGERYSPNGVVRTRVIGYALTLVTAAIGATVRFLLIAVPGC
jgi:hypothetical protein